MDLHIYSRTIEPNPINYKKVVLKRYELANKSIDTLDAADMALVNKVSEVLEKPETFNGREFLNFPLEAILRYLENTHTLYLFKYVPEITQSITHILKLEDNYTSSLHALEVLFMDFRRDLKWHIHKEETDLFPHIRYLLGSLDHEISIQLHQHRNTTFSLESFVDEHAESEVNVGILRNTLSYYTPNAETKTMVQVLHTQLNRLENDLLIHSRIEEEVLIPLTIRLRK